MRRFQVIGATVSCLAFAAAVLNAVTSGPTADPLGTAAMRVPVLACGLLGVILATAIGFGGLPVELKRMPRASVGAVLLPCVLMLAAVGSHSPTALWGTAGVLLGEVIANAALQARHSDT